MATKKFDKETKVMLLQALQRGYFIDTDVETLRIKNVIPMYYIQVTNEKAKKTLENFFEKE